MEQKNVGISHSLRGQEGQNALNEIDYDDFWGEDDTTNNFVNDSDSSVLNREWERRHNQFHTMGYRDGITAGKEASAQEGFNEGFKQSVYAGYNWGLVRGVSSVLETLPDQLTEKLVCNLGNKERFRKLCESTRPISTDDAFLSFRKNLLKNEITDAEELSGNISCTRLDSFSKELSLLLRDCPEIQMNVSHAEENDG